MGGRRISGLAGLVAVLAIASSAGSSPAASEEEARQHFQVAVTHYKLGRFEPALQEYTRAYELTPLPALLFNIGQCHRQLGNYERAIFFFEGYLREADDGTNRELITRLIAESRAALDADRAAALQRRHEEEERRQREAAAALARQRDEERLLAAREAAQRALAAAALVRAPEPVAAEPVLVALPPPTAVTTEVPVYRRWWFWTAAAGVTAAVVTGTVIALSVGGDERTVLPSGSLGTLDRRGGTP